MTTWENRCYSNGIPDAVQAKLQASGRAPSWRAVAIAILRNDHNLHTIGFQATETRLSTDLYKSLEKTKDGQLRLL